MESAATRKARERARKRAAGLVKLEVWIHPDDHAAVKAYAAKRVRARERAA